MKIAIAFAFLASMLCLSLASATHSPNDVESFLGSLALTLEKQSGKFNGASFGTSNGDGNNVDVSVADSPSQGGVNQYGYVGKYNESVQPVFDHLAKLREQLLASIKSSAEDVQFKTAYKENLQKAYEKAAGALDDAKTLDAKVSNKANEELELLDLIVEMLHHLNGKPRQ